MRSLPIAWLIAQARQARFLDNHGDVVEEIMAALANGEKIPISPETAARLSKKAKPWAESRDGRPTALDAKHYTDVASVYSIAMELKTPPLVAVIERWTTTRSTASRWVAACRAQGLLPPTERGRPKGNSVVRTDAPTKKDS